MLPYDKGNNPRVHNKGHVESSTCVDKGTSTGGITSDSRCTPSDSANSSTNSCEFRKKMGKLINFGGQTSANTLVKESHDNSCNLKNLEDSLRNSIMELGITNNCSKMSAADLDYQWRGCGLTMNNPSCIFQKKGYNRLNNFGEEMWKKHCSASFVGRGYSQLHPAIDSKSSKFNTYIPKMRCDNCPSPAFTQSISTHDRSQKCHHCQKFHQKLAKKHQPNKRGGYHKKEFKDETPHREYIETNWRTREDTNTGTEPSSSISPSDNKLDEPIKVDEKENENVGDDIDIKQIEKGDDIKQTIDTSSALEQDSSEAKNNVTPKENIIYEKESKINNVCDNLDDLVKQQDNCDNKESEGASTIKQMPDGQTGIDWFEYTCKRKESVDNTPGENISLNFLNFKVNASDLTAPCSSGGRFQVVCRQLSSVSNSDLNRQVSVCSDIFEADKEPTQVTDSMDRPMSQEPIADIKISASVKIKEEAQNRKDHSKSAVADESRGTDSAEEEQHKDLTYILYRALKDGRKCRPSSKKRQRKSHKDSKTLSSSVDKKPKSSDNAGTKDERITPSFIIFGYNHQNDSTDPVRNATPSHSFQFTFSDANDSDFDFSSGSDESDNEDDFDMSDVCPEFNNPLDFQFLIQCRDNSAKADCDTTDSSDDAHTNTAQDEDTSIDIQAVNTRWQLNVIQMNPLQKNSTKKKSKTVGFLD